MQPRIPPDHKTDTYFSYSHGSGDRTTTTKSGTTFTARWHQTRDLHTRVFGGVLGNYFINVLTEVGNQPNMGKDKFLQVTNTLFDAALVWTGSKERRRHD
jgi:hypothetical protein